MTDINGSLNLALVWDFASLLASLTGLILCLRIVWRVEKKLDRFFKILFFVLLVFAIRSFSSILANVGMVSTSIIFNKVADFLPLALLAFGLFGMNSLIKDLDGER